MNLSIWALAIILCYGCADQKKQDANQVLEIIDNVNTYWQNNNSAMVNSFWDNAAYHTANMEAYFLTQNPDYLQYSTDWAQHNECMGAKSNDKSDWKYRYG